jgi:hypothetical protein
MNSTAARRRLRARLEPVARTGGDTIAAVFAIDGSRLLQVESLTPSLVA